MNDLSRLIRHRIAEGIEPYAGRTMGVLAGGLVLIGSLMVACSFLPPPTSPSPTRKPATRPIRKD